MRNTPSVPTVISASFWREATASRTPLLYTTSKNFLVTPDTLSLSLSRFLKSSSRKAHEDFPTPFTFFTSSTL